MPADSPSPPPSIRFPFPYSPPYPVQQSLMQAIFEVIEGGRSISSKQLSAAAQPSLGPPTEEQHWANVGIMESPTGTGKTLSLLCASLHWLLDHHPAHALPDPSTSSAAAVSPDASTPSWVTDFFQDQAKKEREEVERLLERKRAELLEQEAAYHSRMQGSALVSDKKRGWQHAEERKAKQLLSTRVHDGGGDDGGDDDDADLVTNFVDNEEPALPLWKRVLQAEESAQAERVAAAQQETHAQALTAHLVAHPQLIICSRTHSQLQQLVGEIKRTAWHGRVRVVSLGSRQQLCQHDAVRALHSPTRMNDACLDLQKAKDKQTKRAKQPRASSLSSPCPYLDQALLSKYRDHVHTTVRDMEELFTLGRRLGCCSYYGTRSALPTVHVLTMPYQSLLQRSSREALGVSEGVLRGSVIIFDEAHNLADAIVSAHSPSLPLPLLTRGLATLNRYESRYRARFHPSTFLYIQQLQYILTNLIAFLHSPLPLLTINGFLVAARLDHLNLFKILRFMEHSELAKKLHGFEDRYDEGVLVHREDGGSHVIHRLVAFLESLCHADQDGKVLVEGTGGAVELRFLLLNPSVPFLPLVQSARAVLLVGGTMQPFSLIQQQLLPSLPTAHLRTFSCAHVIPPSHLLCLTLGSGPTGHPLLINHDTRNETATLDELTRVLFNLVAAVPDGLVLFFPSYSFLRSLVQHWQETGTMDKLEAKKALFIDSVDVKVEQLMAAYHKAVKEGRGGVLCSVVGGRLSEGINFADELCRGVVLLGMPYANPFDVQVRAKREWLEERGASGKEWYEAMCMRGVNQSVGRSIRHAKDYAAIVLVDSRYGKATVQAGLAAWVRERTVNVDNFGEAVRSLRGFFKRMRGEGGTR